MDDKDLAADRSVIAPTQWYIGAGVRETIVDLKQDQLVRITKESEPDINVIAQRDDGDEETYTVRGNPTSFDVRGSRIDIVNLEPAASKEDVKGTFAYLPIRPIRAATSD